MADAILRGSGIYAIRNTVNGKIYIGSAVSLEARFAVHRSRLKSKTHHSAKLQASWHKHGAEAFVFEVIECVKDKTQLIQREQYWMDFHNVTGPMGYNMRPKAESSLGYKHSAEMRKKNGDARRGRKHTPEHIAKIVAGRAGYKHSEETKEKISARHKGRPGKPMTEAEKAVLRAHWTGRKRQPMTDEQKETLRLAHTGRKNGPHTSEARALMSEVKLRRAAERRAARAAIQMTLQFD